MYRVIDYIIRPEFKNWEGAIIEEVATGKRFITNGFYKWNASEKRLVKCKIVDSIDIDSFLARWNIKFFRGEIELKG